MSYILNKLEVEFQKWGEHKGKFTGKISFQDEKDIWNSFTFTLSPEETQKYIELISTKIVDSANELGNKLIESLNLKQDVKE